LLEFTRYGEWYILLQDIRGYFLTGNGVRLNQALISYCHGFLEERDYTLMQTHHMMTKEAISRVTQLSEYEETLYKLNAKRSSLSRQVNNH